MRMRAKVSRMGNKYVIVVPTAYHKDIEKFVGDGKYVDIQITAA